MSEYETNVTNLFQASVFMTLNSVAIKVISVNVVFQFCPDLCCYFLISSRFIHNLGKMIWESLYIHSLHIHVSHLEPIIMGKALLQATEIIWSYWSNLSCILIQWINTFKMSGMLSFMFYLISLLSLQIVPVPRTSKWQGAEKILAFPQHLNIELRYQTC